MHLPFIAHQLCYIVLFICFRTNEQKIKKLSQLTLTLFGYFVNFMLTVDFVVNNRDLKCQRLQNNIPLTITFVARSESTQWIFFWHLAVKVCDTFVSLSHIRGSSLIHSYLSTCVNCLHSWKGENREETKDFLSTHCSCLQQYISPRAKVPPPPLTVLDILIQGGHADPISWCCSHPIGGHNTPHPYSIYLLVLCASVWPLSNALGCPSDNSL